MNWVGGVRSRLKQHNERKVQKDYFERKRLMAKMRRAQPPSPGEGKSMRLISQDLLFLQTLSHAHDSEKVSQPAQPARQAMKVDLAGERGNFKRPDRDLELPMSPIGDPSSLELLDTTSSSLSFYANEEQPKVSTQKIPHHTAFHSFGPARPKASENPKQYQYYNQMTSKMNTTLNSTSCMTESIFPLRKKSQWPKLESHQGAQAAQKTTYKANNPLMSANPWESGLLGKRRKQMSRPRSVWEKSFDHETPYDFGSRVSNLKKPRLQQLPPKSKGSLLEFHHNQADREHQGGQQFMKALRTGHALHSRASDFHMNHKAPMILLEEAKPTVSERMAAVPVEKASQPVLSFSVESSDGWGKSRSSSALDEEPLFRRRLGCKYLQSISSTSEESILGPLSKQAHEEKSVVHAPVGIPKVHNRVGLGLQLQEPIAVNTLSTFEKMMQSFEERKGSVSTSQDQEVGKGEPQAARPANTHDSEWKNFISGVTHAETKPPKPEEEAPQRKPKPLRMPEETSNTRASEQKKSSKGKKPFPGYSTIRSKNISVMEELLCLDEELTSSLESDIMASQEFTLTPADFSEYPIRRVPDIDTENPLMACDLSQEETEEQFDERMIQEEHSSEEQPKEEVTNTEANLPLCEVGVVECSTQTESRHTAIFREASCECDIWSEESVSLKVRTKDEGIQILPQDLLCTENISTQTSTPSLADCETQTEDIESSFTCKSIPKEPSHVTVAIQTESENADNSFPVDRADCVGMSTPKFVEVCLQTDPLELHKIPLEDTSDSGVEVLAGKNTEASARKNTATADTATVTASVACAEVQTLSSESTAVFESQIALLKEELQAMQSTLAWQSLMIKLYQTEIEEHTKTYPLQY